MSMIEDVETRTRRPNNFDRAVLRLLNFFSADRPLPEDRIYDELKLEAATLPLMGNTVHQFIESLDHTGFLRRDGDGYVLTPKGQDAKSRLLELIGS